MRGFSLTQPWASLVAIGAKQWETRSWRTSYRGQIALHASKGYPRDCHELEFEEPFNTALNAGTKPPLPLGSIIALATITDCLPTERFMAASEASQFLAIDLAIMETVIISNNEYAFGDYGNNRYAFRIENVMRLATPIACRGALNFWPVPDDVLAQIHHQIIDMQHDEAVRAEARGEVTTA